MGCRPYGKEVDRGEVVASASEEEGKNLSKYHTHTFVLDHVTDRVRQLDAV